MATARAARTARCLSALGASAVLFAALAVNQAQAVSTCAGDPLTIRGTEGPDHLRGTPGRDVIVGERGADVINGLGGDDLVCGGPGYDTLIGGSGSDELLGGDGNDLLLGETGGDTLSGDAGADILRGGDDRDWLWDAAGQDIFRGEDGRDIVYVYIGLTHDVFVGGPMRDLLVFQGRGPVTVDLKTEQASGFGNDTVKSFEVVYGTGSDDTLLGDSRSNVLFGLGGADQIAGRYGDDILKGGKGVDFLNGGHGSDQCVDGEKRCQLRVAHLPLALLACRRARKLEQRAGALHASARASARAAAS